jgi:hypothetical protein
VEVKLGVGAVAVDDHASHVEIVALKEVGGARVVARDGVDLVFAVVREHLAVVGGSAVAVECAVVPRPSVHVDVVVEKLTTGREGRSTQGLLYSCLRIQQGLRYQVCRPRPTHAEACC